MKKTLWLVIVLLDKMFWLGRLKILSWRKVIRKNWKIFNVRIENIGKNRKNLIKRNEFIN